MSLVGDLIELMDESLPITPSINKIYQEGRHFFEKGDIVKAAKYQRLIYLLHNCDVPMSCKIGNGVNFAHGGIAVLMNRNTELDDYVTVGASVTFGGGKSQKMADGSTIVAPRVGKYTYISTGARIIGAVDIGSFCVIGANAVVLKNIEPFTVVAGVPAKPINRIDKTNYQKYMGYYASDDGRRKKRDEIRAIVLSEMEKYYGCL